MDRLRAANPVDDADGDRWASSEAGRQVRDAVRRPAPLVLDRPNPSPPRRSRRPLLVAAVLVLGLGAVGVVATRDRTDAPEGRTGPPASPAIDSTIGSTDDPGQRRSTTTALAPDDLALCRSSAFPVLADPRQRPAPDASLQMVSGTVALRFGHADDPLHWYRIEARLTPPTGDRPARLERPDGPVDALTSTEIIDRRPYMTLAWTDPASDRTVVVSSLGFRTRAEVVQVAAQVRLVPGDEFAAYLDAIDVPNPCAGRAASDPSTPTAMARAAADAMLAEPAPGDDCGTTAADAGWPTTTVAPPLDAAACLRAARSAGRAAHQSFTGRTGDGGALATRYLLAASGEVEVQRWMIDAQGETQETTTRCAPPDGAWLIGVEGGVAVVGGPPASC